MRFIHDIVEPNVLLLTWQRESMSRRVVGMLERASDGRVRLRYLPKSHDWDFACAEGFSGHTAFPNPNVVYENNVLETFRNRLPPRGRSDFVAYLHQFRLRETTELSDFGLLGYTGARLPSDRFCLLPTFESAVAPFQFVSEVSGVRHHAAVSIDELHVDQLLTLRTEPSNAHDPRAIRVELDDRLIGYVNRCQTSVVHRYVAGGRITATVERLNGTPERRAVYMFLSFLPASHPEVRT